ncbi:unnamed protein product [Nezara viridula]|uniref:Uncharacterized protein n=1 Tax=Nezara viridula TaxID=85310 RepID=A0A9P0E7M9_NEZVI|nr:unnamed protein product [Nezara viridula]
MLQGLCRDGQPIPHPGLQHTPHWPPPPDDLPHKGLRFSSHLFLNGGFKANEGLANVLSAARQLNVHFSPQVYFFFSFLLLPPHNIHSIERRPKPPYLRKIGRIPKRLAANASYPAGERIRLRIIGERASGGGLKRSGMATWEILQCVRRAQNILINCWRTCTTWPPPQRHRSLFTSHPIQLENVIISPLDTGPLNCSLY